MEEKYQIQKVANRRKGEGSSISKSKSGKRVRFDITTDETFNQNEAKAGGELRLITKMERTENDGVATCNDTNEEFSERKCITNSLLLPVPVSFVDQSSVQDDEDDDSKQDIDPLMSDDSLESSENVDNGSEVIIMAGPTTPLIPRRIQSIKPMNFNKEPLHLYCEWDKCSFETNILEMFMEHVVGHIPTVEIDNSTSALQVFLVCNWKTCPFKTPQSEDLQRHIYLHAYHTKLKCIGSNTAKRSNLNSCRADAGNRNILPDLSDNLICAWSNCSEKFINIQHYYNHIRYHCEDNEKGRNVPGGIHCLWTGCSAVFSNVARLRDHVRSHTQEKLLSCPICGALFSNRTRFFDHCRRQTLLENQNYACNACMKMFSTARLLRDHIRSHVNTYRCPHCDMSCSSPSGLNSHVKYRHSDDKPYQCVHCSYAAKSTGDLVRHTKVHGPITYNCKEEGCDYTAKSLISITHHFDKIHCESRESKYVCHVCDKRFLRGYYLTKHLTSAHGLQWPSGHSRFRYKLGEDSLFRLFTLRYESEDPDSVQLQESNPNSNPPGRPGEDEDEEQYNSETLNLNQDKFMNNSAAGAIPTLAEQILNFKDPEVTYVVYPTNDINIKL